MRTSARSAERRIRRSESPARPIGSWPSTFNPATIPWRSCPTFCCIIAPCSSGTACRYAPCWSCCTAGPIVQSLRRGVVNMKESTTYQAILDEGKAEGEAQEARKMLLLLGRDRFGEPSAKIVAQLDAVTDLARLEALGLRLLHVKTWEE